MSSPTNPHREQPNTYFVQDRSNQNEMTRLQIQDQKPDFVATWNLLTAWGTKLT
jgi:hypothetical protein